MILSRNLRVFGANLQKSMRSSDCIQLSFSLKRCTNTVTNELIILRQFLIMNGVSFLIQYLSPHIIVVTSETNVNGLFQLLTNFTLTK